MPDGIEPVDRTTSTVTVTFNEQIYRDGSLAELLTPDDYGPKIELRIGAANGPPVPGTGSYDPASFTYTISLDTTLAASTTYVIYVRGGPDGIFNASGVSLANAAGAPIPFDADHTFRTPYPTVLTWSGSGEAASMRFPRREFGAVSVDGRFYAIGGLLPDITITDAVEAYDATTNQWVVLPSLPVARHAPAVAAYGQRIYVFGGGAGSSGWTQQVDVFDTTSSTWSTAASMPTRRAYTAAAELNGKIYVAGGTWQGAFPPGVGSQSAIVEMYDPATNTWSTVAPMSTARSQLTLTATNGRLFAIGGPRTDLGMVVEMFIPPPEGGPLGTWTPAPSLPAPRSFHGAAVLHGYLYVVGGLIPRTETTPALAADSVFVYDPSLLGDGSWLTATPLPAARIAFGGTIALLGTDASPPRLRFLAAGGSIGAASGNITGTVTLAGN